jgi:hypothetical protein
MNEWWPITAVSANTLVPECATIVEVMYFSFFLR